MQDYVKMSKAARLFCSIDEGEVPELILPEQYRYRRKTVMSNLTAFYEYELSILL